MKKLIKFKQLSAFLSLVLLAVPFNSCTDLEAEVFSDLTPSNFPSGEIDVVASFASAYTTLYNFQNHGGYMSSIEIASDEACIPQRGSDWFDGGIWLRQHRHQYNALEGHLNGAWTFLYRGALQANSVIELLNGPAGQAALDETRRSIFTAEARALRALFYYWLIDAFGDVPLALEGVENFDPAPRRTPRAEVYNFIVTELEEASSVLPRQQTYARFNYYAAQALLSRVYLNGEVLAGQNNYQKAIDAANNVIGGPYRLLDDYHANFGPDNDNGLTGTDENILVIPYDPVNAPGFNLPQMTLHYNSQATFNLQDQPWNGYCTLQEFYESYDDADRRKGVYGDASVPGNFLAGPQFAADGVSPILDGTFDDPDGPELVYTPEINELEPGAYRQAGARIYKFRFENGSPNTISNDFPLIRYSEVLLNKAEAIHRLRAGDPEALMLVNMVRARAYGSTSNNFATLTDDNLLAERGRELFFEGHRRSDLIRFGRYGSPWWEKPASDASKQVFPVPANQINGNPNLTQNPGY